MSRLIDGDELSRHIYEDIPIKVLGSVARMAQMREIVAQAPTVEAVPMDGLCGWLAGYAAPPKYAIDACGGAETMAYADKRVEAWKYHFKNLMGCDLL